MTPPINDPEALRRILTNTDALLLDFDGPICQVFAGIPAPVVADQLRDVLAEIGYTDLPPDAANATDPFDILFYAARIGQDEARYVEAAFRAHEVEAVQSARPTSAAIDLVRAWNASSRPLAIVSNNSVTAIETYLDLYNFRAEVDLISARAGADIALLKPSPFLLTAAIDGLAADPARCTFIGDSVTDIEAAQAAHVRAIGFANKPGKAIKLTNAHANAITMTMDLRSDLCMDI